jgi:hypothetical protein
MGGLTRFGRGCWNCGGAGGWGNAYGNRLFWGNGWGWGFGGWGFGGWGFGWPWFGFGYGNPFWLNPWWGAGPVYGYGYYGYPSSTVYSYPDSGYSPPEDNSNPPPPLDVQDNQENQDNQDNLNGNWIMPNGPSPSIAPNSGTLNVPVLIYLKSGAVYAVRDYWMIDGELHFILMNGMQNSLNLEQIDLPRTNTENVKSGVKFIYKSQPSITAPVPDGNGTPPGASEPSPTLQMNTASQPEART